MPFFLSLRWRLLGAYILLVGGLLVVLALVLVDRVRDQFVENRTRQAAEVVSWALAATEPLGERTVQDLDELVARFGSVPNADFSFFLIEVDGDLVRNLGQGAPEYVPIAPARPDVSELIATSREFSFISAQGGTGYPTLIYVAPVRDGEGVLLGAIQAEVRLDEAQLAIERFGWLIATGFFAAFAATSVIGFFLTRTMLSGLEDVAKTARAVERGDLKVRVSIPRARDETRSAAIAFNRMLSRIDAQIARERKAQEAMRQFLADASHEIRSPLTSIRGYVDVLMRGAKHNPQQLDQALDGILASATRMTRLTNDLLTLGQLDEAPDLSIRFIEMGDICREVIEMGAMIAGERKLTFKASGQCWVNGDRELLHRVLWNLFENAVRHTAERGRIDLLMEVRELQCVITVEDDGEGIAAEHLPRIFDRFYKAHPGRPGSSGLGLAIVKKAAEAHGGTIDVDSEVGNGTKFRLTLPATPPPSYA